MCIFVELFRHPLRESLTKNIKFNHTLFTPMHDLVTAIREEFETLEQTLSDPSVVSHPEKLAELGKRRTELLEILSAAEALEKTERTMRDNATLINSDTDPEMQALAMEENATLATQKPFEEAALKKLLLPKDPRNARDVIVEIRAGAGGDESALFAGSLFRMYARHAEQIGWEKDTFPIKSMETIVLELVPDKPGHYSVHDHNLTAVTGGGFHPKGMLVLMAIDK